jgi:hypothetical protein
MSIPSTDDLRLTTAPRQGFPRLSGTTFAVVLGLLAAFWTASVIVVLVGFSLRAWDDRGHQAAVVASLPSAVPVPTTQPVDARPAAVPASAQTVERNLVLGDVAEGIHFFEHMQCDAGVMTIVTSKETLYAEVPCDRMLPDTTLARLRAQVIRIRLVDGSLFLEAFFVSSFRFDGVGRVWLETR